MYMEMFHDYYKFPYLHEEAKAFEEDLPGAHCPTGEEVRIWDETEGPAHERAEKARIAAEREAIFQAEQAAQRALNERNDANKDDPCSGWGVGTPAYLTCKLGQEAAGAADDATGGWLSSTADKIKWFAIFMVAITLIK